MGGGVSKWVNWRADIFVLGLRAWYFWGGGVSGTFVSFNFFGVVVVFWFWFTCLCEGLLNRCIELVAASLGGSRLGDLHGFLGGGCNGLCCEGWIWTSLA